jgi:uncharacterized membrane protein YsdA (DUF1294 family)
MTSSHPLVAREMYGIASGLLAVKSSSIISVRFGSRLLLPVPQGGRRLRLPQATSSAVPGLQEALLRKVPQEIRGTLLQEAGLPRVPPGDDRRRPPGDEEGIEADDARLPPLRIHSLHVGCKVSCLADVPRNGVHVDRQAVGRIWGERISEKVLYVLAVGGGTAGIIFAGLTGDHKTSKPEFWTILGLMTLVPVAFLVVYFFPGLVGL